MGYNIILLFRPLVCSKNAEKGIYPEKSSSPAYCPLRFTFYPDLYSKIA